MPITATFPPPGIGPGIVFTLSSSYSGPLVSPVFWEIRLYEGQDLVALFWVENWQVADIQPKTFQLMSGSSSNVAPQAGAQAFGGTCTAIIDLIVDGSTGVESLRLELPWTDANLGQQAVALAAPTGGGGFTTADRALLTDVHQAVPLLPFQDSTSLLPLSSGPTAGPIDHDLVAVALGVLVRLSTIPPELIGQTPDRDYVVASLAVVRVYHASDLWLRVPVHTTNKIVSFRTSEMQLLESFLDRSTWAQQLHLQVTFRDGVLGEVFLIQAV